MDSEGFNLVQLYGENVSSCGYCSGKRCSVSFGMVAKRLSVQVSNINVALRLLIQSHMTWHKS